MIVSQKHCVAQKKPEAEEHILSGFISTKLKNWRELIYHDDRNQNSGVEGGEVWLEEDKEKFYRVMEMFCIWIGVVDFWVCCFKSKLIELDI